VVSSARPLDSIPPAFSLAVEGAIIQSVPARKWCGAGVGCVENGSHTRGSALLPLHGFPIGLFPAVVDFSEVLSIVAEPFAGRGLTLRLNSQWAPAHSFLSGAAADQSAAPLELLAYPAAEARFLSEKLKALSFV